MSDDRRVRKTREALRRALLELMREKGYEATTIQEIVERADVGRSTFYDHYADKEDLLRENLGALAAHLRDRMALEAAGHPALAFARPMLEHMDMVRPMFVGLLGEHRSPVVQACFEDELAGLVRGGLDDGGPVDTAAVEVMIVGAFLALARWWMIDAPELDVEEVHAVFSCVIGPAMVSV